MSFRKLLAVLAVIGIAIGVLSQTALPASATDIGGNIDVTLSSPTGTNNIQTGQNFTVTVALTGATTDQFFAFNTGLGYDQSKVTLNSITSPWNQGFNCAGASTSLANNTLGFAPFVVGVLGCSSTANPAPNGATGVLAVYNFTALAAVGPTAVNLVDPNVLIAGGAPAAVVSGLSTYTLDNATLDIQSGTLSCTDYLGNTVNDFVGNAQCPLNFIPGLTPNASLLLNIVLPPSDVSVTKTASAASTVAGQPIDYTITATNTSSGTAAYVGNIVDTVPAAMVVTSFTGPTYAGGATGPASCGAATQNINCGAFTIPPGGSVTLVVHTSSNGSAGGTSQVNQACISPTNDVNTANDCSSANVNLIAPAVAWSKTPTNGNVWLAENNISYPGTFTFDEVMTNQGDPNGLGGFSFDLHYDPTQYVAPTIDLSPAIALFAANGRVLSCNIGTASNGIIHVACASTGPIGTGPVFVGAQVMAHVTLVPQAFLVQSIRPNKENGDVSWVKDDQVQVTNTCGQPLNDGTIQPLPGQPECQGVPLQGVGPSGILDGNPNGGESVQTIRRLEGDITKDCSVNGSDMQLEASKFGTSTGSLLYSLFYDVNSPLQRGDGEIDINDVQFVFGRFGSTCANPIPAQPPASLP